MTAPEEYVQALLIDRLCQRWGCTPSQLLAEPAWLVFHTVSLANEERKEQDGS
jgi:hypothetical protein